jgi:hypothetical protein
MNYLPGLAAAAHYVGIDEAQIVEHDSVIRLYDFSEKMYKAEDALAEDIKNTCAELNAALRVGQGVTIYIGSDRHAATITRVISTTRFEAQYDEAHIISGSARDGSARYMFTRNDEGVKLTFRLDKKGRFVSVGGGTYHASVGARRHYYDPHF